ncbi:hypothetical protein D3C87_1773560 [compost metagenome]
MEAVPVKLAYMYPEFSAAIANVFAQHEVFAEIAVGAPKSIALLFENLDTTLDALLDFQFGVLEVVT